MSRHAWLLCRKPTFVSVQHERSSVTPEERPFVSAEAIGPWGAGALVGEQVALQQQVEVVHRAEGDRVERRGGARHAGGRVEEGAVAAPALGRREDAHEATPALELGLDAAHEARLLWREAGSARAQAAGRTLLLRLGDRVCRLHAPTLKHVVNFFYLTHV